MIESSGNFPLLWFGFSEGKPVTSSGNLPIFWGGVSVNYFSGEIPLYLNSYLNSSGSLNLFTQNGNNCVIVSGIPSSGFTQNTGLWYGGYWIDAPLTYDNNNNTYGFYPLYSYGSGEISTNLIIKRFGFNIPSGTEIHGITFTKFYSGILLSGVRDYNVKLYFSGQPISNNRGVDDVWSSNPSYRTYGSNNDNWGATLTSEIVNDPEFGIGISVTHRENYLSGPPSYLGAAITETVVSINYCYPNNESSGSINLYTQAGYNQCTEVSKYPQSGLSILSSGAWSNWTDPQLATTNDSSNYAFNGSIVGNTVPSPVLFLKNFGFNIPNNVEVHGITFKPLISGFLDGSYTSGTQDYDVKLYLSGQPIGNNKGVLDIWPNVTTQRTYGGPEDNWGVNLSPTLINDPEFGVGISIRSLYLGGSFINFTAGCVFNAEMVVNYCYDYDYTSGSLPLNMIGVTASSGGVDLYLSGPQLSSGNLNLFMPGNDTNSGSFPLYVAGPIIYSGEAPLFISGPVPASSTFPLYIEGIGLYGPNPSGFVDLYLESYGQLSSNVGSDGDWSDDNGYRHLINRGIGFNPGYPRYILTGGLSSLTSGEPSDYLPLYIRGYDGPLDDILNLYLEADTAFSDNLTLFLKNEYSSKSGSIPMFLSVDSGTGLQASSIMPLYISRNYETYDWRMDLYLQTGNSKSGELSLYMYGGGNSGAFDMYIYGRPDSSGFIPFYIRGY